MGRICACAARHGSVGAKVLAGCLIVGAPDIPARQRATPRDGRHLEDDVLGHIWPTHYENVHFYGARSVDIGVELAEFDADGYRALRPAASGD
jgi:hypothetical protein